MQRECPSQSARLELHVRLGCGTRERLELWDVLEGGTTATRRNLCASGSTRDNTEQPGPRAETSEKRGASMLWRTEEATSNELVRQPVAQHLLVRGT